MVARLTVRLVIVAVAIEFPHQSGAGIESLGLDSRKKVGGEV